MTMHIFPLEYIPDMLIGKLLQADVVVSNVSINASVDQDLCLFVSIQIFPGTLQQHMPQLILATARAGAELCLPHPQLDGIIVHVTATNEGRWGTSQTVYMQRTTLASWHAGGLSDEAVLDALVPYVHPHYSRSGAWQSRIRSTITQDVYEEMYHLDRLPRILMGKAHTLGLSLDAAHVHRDQDGHLVLYAEFPVDEQTDRLKEQHILSIVQCAGEFLQAFPELQRLAIWTRPEYDDKIAISTFWIDRARVLAWHIGKISDVDILAACRDYRS